MTMRAAPEIVHVQSNLGLRPGGVETLGAVLPDIAQRIQQLSIRIRRMLRALLGSHS